jgi:hypothetical protein
VRAVKPSEKPRAKQQDTSLYVPCRVVAVSQILRAGPLTKTLSRKESITLMFMSAVLKTLTAHCADISNVLMNFLSLDTVVLVFHHPGAFITCSS